MDYQGDGYYVPLDNHRHPLHVETVLNHRLRRCERLISGECLEGFIVGFGIDVIPPGICKPTEKEASPVVSKIKSRRQISGL
jgi:hypothetical protein